MRKNKKTLEKHDMNGRENFLKKRKAEDEALSKGVLKGTKQEIMDFVDEMRNVFDLVRLVDAESTKEIDMDCIDLASYDGMDIREHKDCFAVWGRDSRCANCVSARVMHSKGRESKLEFIDDSIYQIISIYVEMDDKPFVMELVFRSDSEMLLGAYGKTEFMNLISNYNKQFYFDTLTGVYNRRYYEEQVKKLTHLNSVAMIDGDNFKSVNDKYGHVVGDKALVTMARAIKSCVRSNDRLVRYGGDEFVLLMSGVPKNVFEKKLESIIESVSKAKIEGYPDIKLSVTIGGAYNILPVDKAVEFADKLMYKGKQTMKNVVVENDI